MAKTDYQSIDEYHAAFEGEALARMQQIRVLVHEIAPEVQEVISYQIPAFKIGPKYYLVYYCAFPKHITLSSVWSEGFLENFKADLKGMKVSKSAIQFPLDKPFPLELLRRMIEFRKLEYQSTH